MNEYERRWNKIEVQEQKGLDLIMFKLMEDLGAMLDESAKRDPNNIAFREWCEEHGRAA